MESQNEKRKKKKKRVQQFSSYKSTSYAEVYWNSQLKIEKVQWGEGGGGGRKKEICWSIVKDDM